MQFSNPALGSKPKPSPHNPARLQILHHVAIKTAHNSKRSIIYHSTECDGFQQFIYTPPETIHTEVSSSHEIGRAHV